MTKALFHLHVDWRSYRFDAILEQGKEQVCDLTVTSDLGVMPYSAEGLQRRTNMFAILRAVQSGFPIRIDLVDGQNLKLTARATLPTRSRPRVPSPPPRPYSCKRAPIST